MYKSLAKTLFVGKSIIFLPSCQSTNDEAIRFMNEGRMSEGSLVITPRQLAGKGQRGNTWESEPELNLTFSILLKPTFLSIARQFDLTICLSMGILNYLKSFGNRFQVKWPNDIYYKDKKLCGILIQNFLKGRQIEGSIVGIGLNINQTSFSVPKATSLSQVTGQKFDLTEVLEGVCHSLEVSYLRLRAGEIDQLKASYLENLYWFGEDHIFKNGKAFSGRIIGISNEGQLEIETREGVKTFSMKEVEFVN